MKLRVIMFLAVLWALVAPAAALAATVVTGDAGSGGNGVEPKMWAALAGLVAPLGTYLLNYSLPFIKSEPVKGIVQVVVAAALGAFAELLEVGTVSLDVRTLEYMLTAVVTALGAHLALYRPAKINYALKGGLNKDPNTPDSDPPPPVG